MVGRSPEVLSAIGRAVAVLVALAIARHILVVAVDYLNLVSKDAELVGHLSTGAGRSGTGSNRAIAFLSQFVLLNLLLDLSIDHSLFLQ